MSAAPLLLASTSPQRRAILEQLGIPFDVIAPRYEEHDPPDADPVEMVCDHARGKARSIETDRLVLAVDTTVALDGRIFGKPENAVDAHRMLSRFAGRTHAVVSGLCLRTSESEVVQAAATLVTFRSLTDSEVTEYVATGEWENRAGGYAIQGRGASLVERIEGDYLNVVGLPAALLIRLLTERFPGVYGVG